MKYFLFSLLLSMPFLAFGQKNIDSKIDSLISVNTTLGEPGLSVGVLQDGNLIYHGNKGLANLEYEIPINDHSVFGLASVTKQFTAACIGVLEHKGLLSVNDDVRKYVPELPHYEDTIRIKHLLNHTSGIRNHNVLLDLQGFNFKHSGYTNESIQSLIFKQKSVNHVPGEKMLYSNSNYVLLALIIERVSGKNIDLFAEEELFTPLKMTNTFFKSDLGQIIKDKAYPYYKEKDEYKQPKSVTHCIGAGGVESTVEDLAKWTKIFLNKDSEFSYLANFITTLDTLNNGLPMTSARGVFVSPYKNYKTINHGGRDWGLRTQIICVPAKGLSVIVLANSEHINAEGVSYEILDLFLPDPKQNKGGKKGKPYKHKAKEISQVEGHYQELNSDLLMHVFLENDTLKAVSSFGRNPVPLVSQSKWQFHRLGNPSVVYSFKTGSRIKPTMTVDFGGAAFYFESVELVSPESVEVEDYIGKYFSEELNVTYTLEVKDGNLVLSYPNNANIALKVGQEDEFGSGRRTKYSFKRNERGEVQSFMVASEGAVKNVWFKKETDANSKN